MKTKFTKGEWVVAICGSNISVWSEDESIIPPMEFDYPGTEDKDRVIANAHLIASAPDMYNFIDSLIGSGLVYGEDIDKALELLAKAKGE